MADHQPVLVKEALEGLAVRRDGWYVDCTYGRGGHTRRILAELGERGRLMALDKDGDAVQHARAHFGDDPRFAVRCSGFEDFRAQVGPWLGSRRLAGVLFDLGISSAQLDAAQRGFSFSQDGPLDMRLNTTEGLTAQQWLRHVEEAELAGVLRRFGEEPRARRIARAIVTARAEAPIATTGRLAAVVEQACGPGKRRIHPATRVFQAIRIHINRELSSLEAALDQCLRSLAAGGRLCVISFHSLEDRIVKRFMARQAKGDPVYAGLPNIPPHARATMRLIGGLTRPHPREVEANPRARSARLRVAERLEAAA